MPLSRSISYSSDAYDGVLTQSTVFILLSRYPLKSSHSISSPLSMPEVCLEENSKSPDISKSGVLANTSVTTLGLFVRKNFISS